MPVFGIEHNINLLMYRRRLFQWQTAQRPTTRFPGLNVPRASTKSRWDRLRLRPQKYKYLS
ncbi:hypothetical protein PISMIDRAFT_675305 [Pisolithus microcarpus 441]|uniref:Uncharacterized protein n=1 Tax=Pisolithus microcarpus 441 TaxID=765257 RepID=A0A0C9YPN0_9AGAM|nr:hypothetical protein PISMIDRAFT_675305 [Pisolithus microcarpus 441]